jgi:hypothetical protein
MSRDMVLLAGCNNEAISSLGPSHDGPAQSRRAQAESSLGVMEFVFALRNSQGAANDEYQGWLIMTVSCDVRARFQAGDERV